MRKKVFLISAYLSALTIVINSCMTEKLDKLMVFQQPSYEYDFSELKVPADKVSFQWITNGNISTYSIYIQRKENADPELSNYIVYFLHGNSRGIDYGPVHFGNMFHEMGLSLFAVEYRGFCIMTNFKTTENSTYEDAEAGINYIINNLGIPATNIIVVGHSLGGGVATEIAKRYKIKALILFATFTSIDESTETVSTYYVPGEWFAESKYDNLAKIDKIEDPVMFIHGTDDTRLKYQFSVELYNKAKEPKKLFTIQNGKHSAEDIIQRGGDTMRREIIHFIKSN